ncbi:unnamed protein product [Ectocarpus sp. 8 AP-2014]
MNATHSRLHLCASIQTKRVRGRGGTGRCIITIARPCLHSLTASSHTETNEPAYATPQHTGTTLPRPHSTPHTDPPAQQQLHTPRQECMQGLSAGTGEATFPPPEH